MTFWRVLRPPPPSSMVATNTVLLVPSYLAPPTGEPVSCTLRMKFELRITGALQLTPSSEWIRDRAPLLLLKSLKEIYIRPYIPLVGSLSTHIDSRSSLLPL